MSDAAKWTGNVRPVETPADFRKKNALECVEWLKEVIEESGCRGLVLVVKTRDDMVLTNSTYDDLTNMLGALEVVKFDMLKKSDA